MSATKVFRDPFGTVLTTPEEIAEFEAWIDAAQDNSDEAIEARNRFTDEQQAEWEEEEAREAAQDAERSGRWFEDEFPE